MTSRVEKARVAFTKIYTENVWRLAELPVQVDIEQRIAEIIQATIRKHGITTVTEFGCGFWNYARRVDWTGITYNGYDVFSDPIEVNRNADGAPNIRFHQLSDESQLEPADLLICKDVLQHLPTEDVLHYLARFKELFSCMLILNSRSPEDNLNGQIAHGEHRSLRLDLPPFNETVEVIDEWDNPPYGVDYREQVCLLRGKRARPTSVMEWAKKLVGIGH